MNILFKHFLFIKFFLGLTSGEYKPFIIEGFQVGLIRPDVMKQLLRFPEVIVFFSS